MKRRETIKTLLVASVTGAAFMSSCKSNKELEKPIDPGYGRTPEELERDAEIMAEEYLIPSELETIAILCDIILPATSAAGSALEAGVPEFVEFIVKDIPINQLKLRGGLMWLENESMYRFEKKFNSCTEAEQMQIIDDVAFPEKAKPEMEYGANFFSLIRFLVLTGYFTTKMGIDDLGYVGNRPNGWDGVPQDVLDKHGLAYEEEWLTKCVDLSTRNAIAQWDEDGNLLN
jgi:hypothetical protein